MQLEENFDNLQKLTQSLNSFGKKSSNQPKIERI